MRARLFQLDSFTTQRFRGNPAAVVRLDAFPSADRMLAIAAENNLAETAFLVPDGDDYRLRWFTPAVEVPLCGHATLASAAVVMERLEPARERVVFHSASGPLHVIRTQTGYRMDFPARPSQRIEVPEAVSIALGAIPVEVHVNAFTYLAVFDDETLLRGLAPDMSRVAQLDRPGLIVTTAGQGDYDVVSRYFAPAKGVPEDPVTGSAHCALAPYWAARLDRTVLRAYQASARGGELLCSLAGDRVVLEGACVFYLEGEIEF
jgi:predicted PhzF superfamily epimerase YddE/YHI9